MPGGPGVIVQPLVNLLARGMIILTCALGAVSSIVTLLRFSSFWGNATVIFSVVAAAASLGQYLFWFFGPDC